MANFITDFKEKQYQAQREQMLKKVNLSYANKAYNEKLEKHTDQGAELTQEQKAVLFAQAVELQFLKSPTGAVFPGLDDYIVQQNGDQYIVSGYCDAPNSYGAMTRCNFKQIVVWTDNGWVYEPDPEAVKNTALGAWLVIAFFALIILGILSPILLL